ncbi:b133 [miniopterid betaherpesvirus 1]|uniref:B133 n=1 Tax=miniopterid betaherpesvirus 1 TaxID=3070189 RepID=I3VQD0_9BETA|nr:b133 [miniopterid betaherpesvirus 1]AFK83974.1 b133 [miniopterid betaherpesvirus 1]
MLRPCLLVWCAILSSEACKSTFRARVIATNGSYRAECFCNTSCDSVEMRWTYVSTWAESRALSMMTFNRSVAIVKNFSSDEGNRVFYVTETVGGAADYKKRVAGYVDISTDRGGFGRYICDIRTTKQNRTFKLRVDPKTSGRVLTNGTYRCTVRGERPVRDNISTEWFERRRSAKRSIGKISSRDGVSQTIRIDNYTMDLYRYLTDDIYSLVPSTAEPPFSGYSCRLSLNRHVIAHILLTKDAAHVDQLKLAFLKHEIFICICLLGVTIVALVFLSKDWIRQQAFLAYASFVHTRFDKGQGC